MTQTYVITGASRGIGLEFVRQLSSQEDTIVYAGARNPQNSKELMNLVDNKKVFAFTIDIDSRQSIENAAAKVSESATEGIDVLINNAGIDKSGNVLDPSNLGILKAPKSEYVRVFETNVGGVSDVTQVFLPLLRKRGDNKVKRIINISSILGSIASATKIAADVGTGNTAYKVSKTALNMLTELFASSLTSESFVVISIHPGWVETDMGGPRAQISVKDSVRHMLSTVNGLTTADNGRFLNYDSQAIAW